MNVPPEFSIVDSRNMGDFSIATFSSFKKADVIKQFEDSIVHGNLEEACNWLIELHISGKMSNIWDTIFIAISKYINLKNPILSSWTWIKYLKYNTILKKFNKNYEYESRNNQEVRNLLADIITIIICSEKTTIFNKLPKISNKDLLYNNYVKNIKYNDQKTINELFPNENGMDKEFKIGLNEIANGVQNGKINDIIYWCIWLDKLHKSKKKNSMEFICPEIESKDINHKYHRDWIWSIWYIILQSANHRSENIVNEINALYNIYKWKYTSASIAKKQYILYHALLLLRENVNWKIPIIYRYEYRVQACCNINQLYKLKKIQEIKHIENNHKIVDEKVVNAKPEIKIKTEKRPKKPFKIEEKDDEQSRMEAKMMQKLEYFNTVVIYRPKEPQIKQKNHLKMSPKFKNIKIK
jgi:hypothetical protein